MSVSACYFHPATNTTTKALASDLTPADRISGHRIKKTSGSGGAGGKIRSLARRRSGRQI
jgi:hypothetical protein